MNNAKYLLASLERKQQYFKWQMSETIKWSSSFVCAKILSKSRKYNSLLSVVVYIAYRKECLQEVKSGNGECEISADNIGESMREKESARRMARYGKRHVSFSDKTYIRPDELSRLLSTSTFQNVYDATLTSWWRVMYELCDFEYIIPKKIHRQTFSYSSTIFIEMATNCYK